MESTPPDFSAVSPTRPAAPWIGGKSKLAGTITPIIDALDHQTYAEPFVGMGGVFLRRTRRPRAEVVNDKNQDVANFFRILQRHYVAFMEMLKFSVTTRAGFERLKETDPATLTDLERAARFLYLQSLAFGGKATGQHFGVSVGLTARFNVFEIAPRLEALHERLSGVVIECLDFGEFLARYDAEATFFYLDPPYWGSEASYGKALFTGADFARLTAALAGLEGRFILSLNDVDAVRCCFADFSMAEVSTEYSIAGGLPKAAAELLISNFDLGEIKTQASLFDP